MNDGLSKIKKELESKFLELRLKRRNIISKFKKKLEEEKIKQIRNSVLNE